MRAQAAGKDRAAIDDEMMRGDRGGEGGIAAVDEIDRVACRHMLEDDLQAGHPLHERRQHALDEHDEGDGSGDQDQPEHRSTVD